jgi:hypothetical protein
MTGVASGDFSKTGWQRPDDIDGSCRREVAFCITVAVAIEDFLAGRSLILDRAGMHKCWKQWQGRADTRKAWARVKQATKVENLRNEKRCIGFE